MNTPGFKPMKFKHVPWKVREKEIQQSLGKLIFRRAIGARGILELARDSVDNQLRNGTTCPNDTDGDGDCGRPYCPTCGTGRQP